MLEKFALFWKKHGFELVLVGCISFILIYALCRIGKKGTYSKTYSYVNNISKKNRYRPPKVSKGEAECRRILQDMFGKPFPNMRPDFLRNPVTGNKNNLEIDCYNDQLKLGVEYSGMQHYKFVPFFHKSKDAFLNQKYRDDMKKRMCKEHGVTLIEVPYTVKNEDIREYLIINLRKLKYI